MRVRMLQRLFMLSIIPLCTAASLIAQDADTDARFALALQFAGTAFGQTGAAAVRVSGSRCTSRIGQGTSRLKILPIPYAKTELTRW